MEILAKVKRLLKFFTLVKQVLKFFTSNSAERVNRY